MQTRRVAGKPLDMKALLKEAGLTPSLQRRATLLASLTTAEFEALLDRTIDKGVEAGDKLETVRPAVSSVRGHRHDLPCQRVSWLSWDLPSAPYVTVSDSFLRSYTKIPQPT